MNLKGFKILFIIIILGLLLDFPVRWLLGVLMGMSMDVGSSFLFLAVSCAMMVLAFPASLIHGFDPGWASFINCCLWAALGMGGLRLLNPCWKRRFRIGGCYLLGVGVFFFFVMYIKDHFDWPSTTNRAAVHDLFSGSSFQTEENFFRSEGFRHPTACYRFRCSLEGAQQLIKENGLVECPDSDPVFSDFFSTSFYWWRPRTEEHLLCYTYPRGSANHYMRFTMAYNSKTERCYVLRF